MTNIPDVNYLGVYTRIEETLQRKAKAASALAGIKFQDLISNAIVHYLNHIDNSEVDLNIEEIFDN